MYWECAENSIGTSLNVLLTQRGLVGTGKNSTSPPFHLDEREEAFCTATTTLPCRTTRGRLQTPRPTPGAARPLPSRVSTGTLLPIPLRVCGIPSAHLVAEWKRPTTLSRRASQQSRPSASPRHWETFCQSRERMAIGMLLQQTQLFTWENIAQPRGFWPRLLPGLLFGPVQPRVSPEDPRQGQVCRKRRGT